MHAKKYHWRAGERSQLLHWLIVALIIIQVTLGLTR